MILAANTFGPGFDSPQLHQHAPLMRNRSHGLINDRHVCYLFTKGLTGFDSIVLCRYKHVVRCVIST